MRRGRWMRKWIRRSAHTLCPVPSALKACVWSDQIAAVCQVVSERRREGGL